LHDGVEGVLALITVDENAEEEVQSWNPELRWSVIASLKAKTVLTT
jgi:hypothetical protein